MFQTSKPKVPQWRVRDDNVPAPGYSRNNFLFTIEFHHGGFFDWGTSKVIPIGYGDGLKAYIDFCDPQELNYLSIVAMAAHLGWMDVRFLYFKRVGSEFETDILKIEYDADAKDLGKFVDGNRVVEVYCEGFYSDDNIGENENSSSGSEDGDWSPRHECLSDHSISEYIDSDGEEIGTTGDDLLVDVGVNFEGDLQKSKAVNQTDEVHVDVSVMDDGYIESDHFSEHGGSDEDENEDAFKLKTPVFSMSDLDKVELKMGMRFPTADDFKEAIREYSIQQGKSIKYKVNARLKMYLYCANTNEQGTKCGWSMYCAKIPDEETVQIRTYVDNHTCSRTIFIASVKPRFIAKKFLEMIRVNPKWPVKNFRVHVAKACQADVSLSKAYRSFRIAKKALQGSSGEQYELLWDYCNELRRTNVGSTIHIKVKPNGGPNGESLFRGIYICWGALKRGFLEGCRPLVGIDGCHLSGPHKGVMLTAVGIDPNNCIYPFAYAIVGHETYKTWKWFIKLLAKDLNITRAEDYTFISDKQKGLIKAVERIIPGVEHRFCVWHLYNNFKLLHKGIALKNLLWKIARSTTKPQFESALEEMKAMDPLAYEWCASRPGEHWSRSHFSTHPKCDLLLNNLCESFNGAIKDPREMPIMSMLEAVRLYLMEFVMKKKLAIEKVKTMSSLCPKIEKKLEVRIERSHQYTAKFNGRDEFEVSGLFSKCQVNLKTMVCGCRSWQLSGIPCPHAICCINYMGYNLEKYVHLCYSKQVYKKTYANVLMPINGRELWEKTGKPKIIPPVVPLMSGRPKKARKRGPGEPKSKQKLSRVGTIMKCGKCKKIGHNSRTCGRPERPDRPNKKAKQDVGVTKTLVDESETDSEMETDVPNSGEDVLSGRTCVNNPEDEPRDGVFVEWENMCEREERGDDGENDGDCDENNEGVQNNDGVENNEGDEDDDFWREASQITQDVHSAHVQQNKAKLPIRRSSRLMFSPNKKQNVVSLVDLSEEEGPSTLHAGIMKAPEKALKNLLKGQIYKNGKIYSSPAAFKVALEHDRIARQKYGSK